MAENKWTDSLRKKMEGYEQTPPEGLWEAVEAGLPGRRAAAFPWMWALAGVAAVALTVVLLWRPEQQTVSPHALAETDNQLTESVDVPPTVQQAEIPVAKKKADVAREETEIVVEDAEAEINEIADNNEIIEITEDAADSGQEDIKQVPEPIPPVPETVIIPSEPGPASKSRVRLTASLLAGSLPGSASSISSGYGLATHNGPMSAKMAPMLSRNKPSQTESHYSVAMRAGALFNLSFSPHWGVETGLMLTNLQNRSKSVTGSATTVNDKTIAYLGIPLMAVWTPWTFDRFSVYASAGPMLEYGFRSFNKEQTYIGDELESSNTFNSKENDLIFSLGLNIGAQWMVSDAGALFLQPGVSWHMAGAGISKINFWASTLHFV